jgi:hypothetical protein
VFALEPGKTLADLFRAVEARTGEGREANA